MTKRELIVRLALTLFVITTPIVWLLQRYMQFFYKIINHIRDVRLASIAKKIKPQAPELDTKKKTKSKNKPSTKNKTKPTPKTPDKAKTTSKYVETKNKTTEEPVEKKLTNRELKQLESIKYSALAYKERGKMDEYEKKLIEGLACDTGNVELLQMLGEHYFNTGNFIKSLSLLKKVINEMPENHKVIRQIGQIYLSQDDKDTAKLLIEKAIKLKPDNPKYHITLVEIHYEQEKIHEAIQSMEKILKLRPTNIDYLLTIATLHEENSEPTKASKYYSKIIELDPMNEMAKKGLRRLSR